MTNDNAKRVMVKMQDLKVMCDTVIDYATRDSERQVLRHLMSMQEELAKALRFTTGTSEYDKLGL